MSAVLLEPTPVPEVSDGMIVRVIYLGQEKMRYVNLDPQGRQGRPEWWNGTTWQDIPCTCTDPFEDERHKPRCQYDGIAYRLECGKEAFMPIEAARCWFGDERSQENMTTGLSRTRIRAWVNDRQTEVRRLRTLYDNRMGDELTIHGQPIVELYTIDDNQRIPTVLDDPLGTNSNPAQMSEAEQSNLYVLIAKQQAQLDQMRRQMEAQNSRPKSSRAPAPTPVDEESDEIDPVPLGSLPEDPNG